MSEIAEDGLHIFYSLQPHCRNCILNWDWFTQDKNSHTTVYLESARAPFTLCSCKFYILSYNYPLKLVLRKYKGKCVFSWILVYETTMHSHSFVWLVHPKVLFIFGCNWSHLGRFGCFQGQKGRLTCITHNRFIHKGNPGYLGHSNFLESHRLLKHKP